MPIKLLPLKALAIVPALSFVVSQTQPTLAQTSPGSSATKIINEPLLRDAPPVLVGSTVIKGFPYRGLWAVKHMGQPLYSLQIEKNGGGTIIYQQSTLGKGGWRTEGNQLVFTRVFREKFYYYTYEHLGKDWAAHHKPYGYRITNHVYRFTPRDGGRKMQVDKTTVEWYPEIIERKFSPPVRAGWGSFSARREPTGRLKEERGRSASIVMDREWAD